MKFILLLLMSFAQAAPPPGAPGEYHEWFEKQRSIGSMPCCSVADGHILNEDEWRATGSGYEVRINDEWIPVPATAMRDIVIGGANPTGHAVVWYLITSTKDVRIYCFAQGFEG
jgi:hypothetical protein